MLLELISGAGAAVSRVEDSRDLQSASNNFRESSAPKPPNVIAFTSDWNLVPMRGTFKEYNDVTIIRVDENEKSGGTNMY